MRALPRRRRDARRGVPARAAVVIAVGSVNESRYLQFRRTASRSPGTAALHRPCVADVDPLQLLTIAATSRARRVDRHAARVHPADVPGPARRCSTRSASCRSCCRRSSARWACRSSGSRRATSGDRERDHRARGVLLDAAARHDLAGDGDDGSVAAGGGADARRGSPDHVPDRDPAAPMPSMVTATRRRSSSA